MVSPNGKSFSVAKGKPQSSGENEVDMGDDADELVIESNLPQPRQKLAFCSQEFLVETLKSLEKTAVLLPIGFNVEITGRQEVHERKYIKVDFYADFTTSTFPPEGNVVQGVSPVRTVVSLRKGLHTVNNQTLLKLSYDEFLSVVKQGRILSAVAQNFVGKKVAFSSLEAQRDFIIRESVDQNTKKNLIIILRMVFEKNTYNNRLSAGPVFHIREFYQDPKSQKFKPGKKGITVGLLAFYKLVYPMTTAISYLQDSFVKTKIRLDEVKARAQEDVDRLSMFDENWEKDPETEDWREENIYAEDFQGERDDLSKIEKEQRDFEKSLAKEYVGDGGNNEEEEEEDEESEDEPFNFEKE